MHADGVAGRHPPLAHLGAHLGDEFAGVDRPFVDLLGQTGEQCVLENATLGFGEQQLLIGAGGRDAGGELADRRVALVVLHLHDGHAVRRVPLQPVVLARGRELGVEVLRAPWSARCASTCGRRR